MKIGRTYSVIESGRIITHYSAAELSWLNDLTNVLRRQVEVAPTERLFTRRIFQDRLVPESARKRTLMRDSG